jgi:hypothetical protein
MKPYAKEGQSKQDKIYQTFDTVFLAKNKYTCHLKLTINAQ